MNTIFYLFWKLYLYIPCEGYVITLSPVDIITIYSVQVYVLPHSTFIGYLHTFIAGLGISSVFSRTIWTFHV